MNDMHHKKKSDGTESALESRRQSVKRILGVGGLAAGGHLASGEWVKPIVNAVLLPAHAQTSGISVDSLEDPCSVSVVCVGPHLLDITVTGAVVPPTAGINVDLDIEVALSNGPFEAAEDFASLVTDGNGEYSTTVTRDQSPITDIRITATLPDFPEAGDATCEVAFDNSNLDHYGGSYFCEYGATPV